ncbi:MAG: hypothetical protein JSR59_04040 [Proteobacteria bacterium]|nr:hypothetical protein [Pseudomonadota bacterium]
MSAVIDPRADGASYVYTGQPFDVAYCLAHFSPETTCVEGSVTGNLTINASIPLGFSGIIDAPASVTLNAAGYSISSNVTTVFEFTNGVLTGWILSLTGSDGSGNQLAIITESLGVADDALQIASPTNANLVEGLSQVAGTWDGGSCAPSLAVGRNADSCNPQIALSRTDLLTIVASGQPTGGQFSYSDKLTDGDVYARIAMSPGISSTTNPNAGTLTNPNNPDPDGAPSVGGLGEYTVNYVLEGVSASNDPSDPFDAATFGMSCYYSVLQSDWGTPPKKCQPVRINGVTYRGAVKNPDGLTGTYCASFIAEVELQGSGVLNSGRIIQYNTGTGMMKYVKAIKGSDGTPVVAGKTLARSLDIIPSRGVTVDLASIGNNLLANDSGGDIVSYRLDIYNGAGKSVCKNYNNIMTVGSCSPGQALCPNKDLQ